jgi:hypothetical protein
MVSHGFLGAEKQFLFVVLNQKSKPKATKATKSNEKHHFQLKKTSFW